MSRNIEMNLATRSLKVFPIKYSLRMQPLGIIAPGIDDVHELGSFLEQWSFVQGLVVWRSFWDCPRVVEVKDLDPLSCGMIGWMLPNAIAELPVLVTGEAQEMVPLDVAEESNLKLKALAS